MWMRIVSGVLKRFEAAVPKALCTEWGLLLSGAVGSDLDLWAVLEKKRKTH